MKNFLKKLAKRNNDANNASPVTVAFLGDSITQGCFEVYKTGEMTLDTVYDIESAYPSKLISLLKMIYPKAQINMINAGISGDSAENGNIRIERDVFAYKPDLVVVCYGLNDVVQGEKYIPNYLNSLKSIFDKIATKNIPCIFMTPNMKNTYVAYTGDALLDNLAKQFSEEQNFGLFDRFMAEAVAVAEQSGVMVCNAYAEWKKLYLSGVDTTKLLCNNLNHPSRQMHSLFAWLLIQTIFGEMP